jgi:hypothetical protein
MATAGKNISLSLGGGGEIHKKKEVRRKIKGKRKVKV